MVCHTWRINIGNSSQLFFVSFTRHRFIMIKKKILFGILIFKNIKNIPWIEAKSVQYDDFNLIVQCQVVIPSEAILSDEE